jgi:hypothetical protein
MPTQKYVSHARLTCQAVQGIARTLKTLEEHSSQSRESFARQIGVNPAHLSKAGGGHRQSHDPAASQHRVPARHHVGTIARLPTP